MNVDHSRCQDTGKISLMSLKQKVVVLLQMDWVLGCTWIHMGDFFFQYLRTNLRFVKTIFFFFCKTKFTAKFSHFFPYFLLSFFLLSFLFLRPSLSLLLFLNLIIWRLINIIGIPSFIFAIFYFFFLEQLWEV